MSSHRSQVTPRSWRGSVCFCCHSLMSTEALCIAVSHCSFEYCQSLSSDLVVEVQSIMSVQVWWHFWVWKQLSQLHPNQSHKLAKVSMPIDTSHLFSWCEQFMAASKLTLLMNFHTSWKCDQRLWHLSDFKNPGFPKTLSFWSWLPYSIHDKLDPLSYYISLPFH